MKQITLPSGKQIPVLGQGTSHMGRSENTKDEVAALRRGIELGMTVIDTAELYDNEELVAEAINGQRPKVYLVTKVMPSNASKKDTLEACDRSLKKLKTDHVDLYLLHWKGSTPLSETFEAFDLLKKSGKILDFGVSNFDTTDLEKAYALDKTVAANQVLYNFEHRGIEWDLLPWCQKHQLPVMAYTPLERGEIKNHPALQKIAARHNSTVYQIALAWVLRQNNLMTIPKSSNITHVEENFKALDIKLSREDLLEIDAAFPPPKKKVALETI